MSIEKQSELTDTLKGKIVKGIAGFYYVVTEYAKEPVIYECKAKGAFRNDKVKPLVGDDVLVEVIDSENKKGNIVSILPRKNQLLRPQVSNVDQAMIVFAVKAPEPNLNLLDRFLLHMEKEEIPTIICFNKVDLLDESECKKLKAIYELAGYKVILISTVTGDGMDDVKKCLYGKTTSLAGPSGVGKSSLMNAICPEVQSQTGEISTKIERGKHTTRHTEIFCIDIDTYVYDTPGFSSLHLEMFTDETLKEFYREFLQYEPECRFAGCMHDKEPDCGVKDALADGLIAKERYDNYIQMLYELKNRRKW